MALGALATGGILAGANALFNVGSQIGTNASNRKLAAQQNEYNLELQNRQFQHNTDAANLEWQRNLEQWNLQNEYNSPSAQMQRYIDAGLNPNLIYGTGSASAGNASASPTYSAAKYNSPSAERSENRAPKLDFDPYQALSFSNQLGIQKAQRDQISAQADYTKQQTKNAAISELINNARHLGLNLDNRKKEALLDLSVTAAKQGVSLNDARLSNLKLDNEIKQSVRDIAPAKRAVVEQQLRNLRTVDDLNKFKYTLLKLGVNDRDNIFVRLGARILTENFGISDFNDLGDLKNY